MNKYQTWVQQSLLESPSEQINPTRSNNRTKLNNSSYIAEQQPHNNTPCPLVVGASTTTYTYIQPYTLHTIVSLVSTHIELYNTHTVPFVLLFLPSLISSKFVARYLRQMVNVRQYGSTAVWAQWRVWGLINRWNFILITCAGHKGFSIREILERFVPNRAVFISGKGDLLKLIRDLYHVALV